MAKKTATAIEIAGKSIFDIVIEKIQNDTHPRRLRLEQRTNEFCCIYYGEPAIICNWLEELQANAHVSPHEDEPGIKDHCHVMVRFDKRTDGYGWIKMLGHLAINCQFEKLVSWEGYAEYLTHADKKSRREGKPLYPPEQVITIGRLPDYKTYLEKLQSENREFSFDDICTLAKNSEALNLYDLDDYIEEFMPRGVLVALRSLSFAQQQYVKDLLATKRDSWLRKGRKSFFTADSVQDLEKVCNLLRRCGMLDDNKDNSKDNAAASLLFDF